MCTWEQETRPPETERVPARDERNPGKSEGKTSATGAGCTGEICLFIYFTKKKFPFWNLLNRYFHFIALN